MKTKEEVIKEAWGFIWGKLNDTAKKCALENNGYISGILANELHQPFTEWSTELKSWRPKSLRGIEDNNGWIRIESEADFPKDSFNYYAFCSNGSVMTFNDFEYYKKYIIPELKATHYQPIIKHKPPIY